MLQNKIYQNFFIEIIKTFLLILLGLSLIALTVRAVNFLELIVDSGYPVLTYFKYSFLNLFGIAPKFIPLAFLLALTIFIFKHTQDTEFLILWSSGVKKIQVVNLFIFTSIIVLVFYLIFTIILTPMALNKSRQLLSKENFNSFLPTVRSQQFSDSFRGFTFLVGKKKNNEIKNIFLYDKENNFSNLSSNISDNTVTTIIAENGLVKERKMFLFNGQIISTKKNKEKNEIIKFEQLNVDLSSISSTTIKKPKLQETSTIKLLNCFIKDIFVDRLCDEKTKREIIPTLNRRIILPFYIPVVSLICSFLLIKSRKKILNKAYIFIYSFTLLLFSELTIRYTGINDFVKFSFIILPFLLFAIFYSLLKIMFTKKIKAV